MTVYLIDGAKHNPTNGEMLDVYALWSLTDSKPSLFISVYHYRLHTIIYYRLGHIGTLLNISEK